MKTRKSQTKTNQKPAGYKEILNKKTEEKDKASNTATSDKTTKD